MKPKKEKKRRKKRYKERKKIIRFSKKQKNNGSCITAEDRNFNAFYYLLKYLTISEHK